MGCTGQFAFGFGLTSKLLNFISRQLARVVKCGSQTDHSISRIYFPCLIERVKHLVLLTGVIITVSGIYRQRVPASLLCADSSAECRVPTCPHEPCCRRHLSCVSSSPGPQYDPTSRTNAGMSRSLRHTIHGGLQFTDIPSVAHLSKTRVPAHHYDASPATVDKSISPAELHPTVKRR